MTQSPIQIETGRAIDAGRQNLAAIITDRQYEAHPELEARYGPIGRRKCLEDAAYHLMYLSEALTASLPHLFSDYIAWAKVMLAGRGVPADDLAANLGFLREALREGLSEEMSALACSYVDRAMTELPSYPEEAERARSAGELAELAERYLEALLRGDRQSASRMILEAADGGVSIQSIYLDVFQRTQHEIGRLWQMNRLSVAQEHYCTAATQLIMSQLYPRIFSSTANGRTMVAACVGGDLHEIGVRMIADFFEMEGWNTFYVGANTPTQSIVQMVVDRRADVLALSATMPFHIRQVASVIGAIRSSPAAGVKILVGGYPFNAAPDLWREVGADGHAHDARDSVAAATALLERGRAGGATA